uniref:EF-hand domain-containing protein n=1 Tax=Ascaris lumbricoides TaxID=6252 RepID=A0A9J2P812_ASCLU
MVDFIHGLFLVSRKGILTLYSRFTSLAKHKNRHTNEIFMSHQDFLDIQELQMNPLGARIIDAFFADAEVGDRKRVYFRDFVKVLSHFRPINKAKPHPWNSREAKLRFAFTMYDLNRSGTITQGEFREILQMMIGDNVPVEQVNGIADRTMREADRDGDGCITFHEFCKVIYFVFFLFFITYKPFKCSCKHPVSRSLHPRATTVTSQNWTQLHNVPPRVHMKVLFTRLPAHT